MKYLIALALAISSFATPSVAQPVGEGGGGVVRAMNGDGLAVPVPKGWVLDNRAMARQGIDMLFYPAKTGFNGFGPRTPVYAFVMPTYKGAPDVSVAGLIQMQSDGIRRADKSASIVIEQPATTDKRRISKVTVVNYAAQELPLFERVAYLEDDRTIYAVILHTSNAADLEEQSSFLSFVIDNHRRLIGQPK
jgi:hypothetical protein